MIGICTDSSSQLPAAMQARYDIEVVPLTIVVDGTEYLEGVDLDADGFWDFYADGRLPAVATAQPSPGQFALAYEQLADRGAREILSVHLGSALSSTISSARLAAHSSPVPVRLVDSGTAGFGVGCCACAAAEAVSGGATLAEAAEVAESLASSIGSVFVVAGLDAMRAGGRIKLPDDDEPDPGRGALPLLTIEGTSVRILSMANGEAGALDLMTDYVARRTGSWNVAVGMAGPTGAAFATRLEQAVRSLSNVDEVVSYRIGPSVGVHTGPGTTGLLLYPSGTRMCR